MRTYKLGYTAGRFTAMVKGQRFSKRGEPSERKIVEAEFAVWLAGVLNRPDSSNDAAKLHERQGRPEVAEMIRNRPAPDVKPTGTAAWPSVEGFSNPTKRRGPIGWEQAGKDYIAFRLSKTGNNDHMRVLSAHVGHMLVAVKGTTVGEFKAEQWERFFGAVMKSKHSPSYRQSIVRTGRSFLNWCHETGRIKELPLCVNSKNFTLKVPPKKQPTFKPEQIKKLLAEGASPRMRAWILVALNCGCTQKDLSELTLGNLNLKDETLTRKRTKHEHQDSEKIPTVVYHLWPETVAAIKATMNKKGKGENSPLWLKPNGGKLVQSNRNDAVAVEFDKLREFYSLGTLTFKSFRKTGTTVLGGDMQTKLFRELYLGNVGEKVTDRNYDQTDELPVEVTNLIRQKLEIGA